MHQQGATYVSSPQQLELNSQVGNVKHYNSYDPKLKEGMMNGTIPSTIVDSFASSNVGTTKDRFQPTGRKSDKVFWLLHGSTQAAMEIAKLPYNVRAPAKDIHITSGINTNSLIGTSKLADVGYIIIFDKDTVKMNNAHNTQVIVTQEAGINGWREDKTGMWQVALVPIVSNVNTNTVLVDQPPTEFLPDQPLPTKAIHNIYELKT
jgi:hypothetical protein